MIPGASADEAAELFESAKAIYADDPEGAERLYERAAELGEPRAMYNLGGLHIQRGEVEVARSWWERAAELGLAAAMYNLGVSCRDRDSVRTVQWWERAAQHGHVDAAYWLGLRMKNSDPVQAKKYLSQAAQGGKVEADYNLGVILSETDPETAEEHYRRAVDSGDVRSMYNLAILLVRRDIVNYEAIDLMRRAADLGYEPAIEGTRDWPRIIKEVRKAEERHRRFHRRRR